MSVNQSIFGIEAPKFDSSGTEVLLDYAVVLRDEPEHEEILFQSVLNNHRTWYDKGDHYTFEVMINLFKYADPLAKFNEIYTHLNSLVTLWRRRDRDAFKDSSGDVVYFELTEITPVWIDSYIKPDQLILLFESTDYVDISKSSIATLVDDLGISLIDDLGTPLPGY